MQFAYTIWCKKHYDNIEELITRTKNIVDYYIITTLPKMPVDNKPRIGTGDFDDATLLHAYNLCRATGKRVGLQIIPTPVDARGKKPPWWQGWIDFANEEDWSRFFGSFQNIVSQKLNLLKDVDFLLLGAEMVSTLKNKPLWNGLFNYARLRTNCPLGYSHHFSMPLKHHYNWQLSLSVLFGYFFRRERVYNDILSRLLTEQFTVPKDQRVEVGKNLYHAPMVNQSDLDFIKLNDYFWYVLDRQYSEAMLRERWERIRVNRMNIEFIPAVRSWLKKYSKNKAIWIENDLCIGYTQASDEYYKLWWEVFLEKHRDIADVIVVWDNGNFRRWAETIRAIFERIVRRDES